MGKNLETLGIMGKRTAKFDVDILSVIVGSFVFPSYISQVSYASKGDINDMVYGGSLFLGANALSGLYEWFRATRNSDPEEKMFLPGSLIDKKSVEELAEIYSQI